MGIPSHCVAVAKLRNPAVHITYFPDRSIFSATSSLLVFCGSILGTFRCSRCPLLYKPM